MRLLRAVLYAYAAAALAVALRLGFVLGGFVFDCAEHRAAVSARAGAPIATRGYAQARPGDALYRCESRHCPALPAPGGRSYLTALCHDDLGCYCARGGTEEHEVARRLVGDAPGPARCELAARAPRADDAGPCPAARCLKHLDP